MPRSSGFFALFLAFFAAKMAAQTPFPPACAGPVPLASTCATACVRCGSLDGFSSATTQTIQGQTVPGFCTTTFHSVKYVAFIAASTSLQIRVTVGACTLGNGIEMGIYKSTNCQNFTLISNCNGAMSTGNQYTFTTNQPLEIGCHYYLIFDNDNPAACAFSVKVLSGSTGAQPLPAPVFTSGPTAVCPGQSAQFCVADIPMACAYEWTAPAGATINGLPSPVSIGAATGRCVTVKFGATGGPVCCRAVNACENGPFSCQNVQIQPIPPTILPTVALCEGEKITWLDGFEHAAPADLEKTFLTAAGCDSVVRQSLELVVPKAAIEPPAALGCLPDTVVLSGQNSVADQLAWFGSGGQPLAVGPTVWATQPGLFVLFAELSKNGKTCLDTAQVVVNQQVTTINFLLDEPDTLDCKTPVATVAATAASGNLGFSWLKNGAFLTAGPSFSSLEPGLFEVVATAADGCSASRFFEILEDKTPPDLAVAMPEILTCKKPTTTVLASSATAGATFEFFKNQQKVANGTSFLATEKGQFSAVVIAPNGCTTTVDFEILEDKKPPVFSVSMPDTLTCKWLETTVFLIAQEPLFDLQWIDSQQVMAVGSSFLATEKGQFSVVAAGQNGCTSSQPFQILEDTTSPVFSVSMPEILTCKKLATTILANSATAGATFEFFKNQQKVANGASFLATEKGQFSAVATAPNGCTATVDFEVFEDIAPPVFSLSPPDVLTCKKPTTTVAATSAAGATAFQFFQNQSPIGPPSGSMNFSQPGIFEVVAEGQNGCTASQPFQILEDKTPPVFSVSMPDVLTCKKASTIVSISSTQPLFQTQWLDNQQVMATGPSFLATQNGSFSVVAAGENDCTATRFFDVFEDKTAPIVAASGGQIDCATGLAPLAATSDAGGSFFTWTGPGGFSASLQNPTASLAGSYFLTVENPANGCTATASATVTASPAAPSIALEADSIDCKKPIGQVSAATDAAQPEFLWTGPGGFLSVEPSFSVAAGGLFFCTVTDVTGCKSTSYVAVAADFAAPNLTISGPDTLTCSQPTATVLASSTTAGAGFQFFENQNLVASGAAFLATEKGQFSVVATGANGCSATAFFEILEDKTPPDLAVSEPEMLTCLEPKTTVVASSATAGATVEFFENQLLVSKKWSLEVDAAGAFSVVATGPNGCTSVAAFSVLEDKIVPVFSLSQPEVLTCQRLETTVVLTSPHLDFTTQWLENQQVISTDFVFKSMEPGLFEVVATGANGCTSVQPFQIFEDKKPPELTVSEPEILGCKKASTQIFAASATAGATVDFFKNQLLVSEISPIEVVAAGLFSIVATAQNGCTTTENVEVLEEGFGPWSVDLGPDTTVFWGEFLDLKAQISLPMNGLERLDWHPKSLFPGGGLSLERRVEMRRDRLFWVEAEDVFGCPQRDSIWVRVERPAVFVPNVFWPDGPTDGNSRWTVFPSSEAVKIQRVQIFDRWGEAIFSENGPVLTGWDGSVRGKKVNPGVFVWLVRLEMPGVGERLLKGDLTVVR